MTTTIEWGFRSCDTGVVVGCDSETEACTMAETANGELVTRAVYETSWADDPKTRLERPQIDS